jgi:hypothetical protein
MTGLPYSIGDPPGMEPELSFPCASCAGEAARRAVHDHVYDLKHDDAFPRDKGDDVDFEDEFCVQITAMADWCHDRAVANAGQDDNEPCERHAPTKDDEE